MSNDENEKQYLIFLKYTREYISQITGYSKGYLCRIATGAREPSEPFIGLCCHTLKESQHDLFKLIEPNAACVSPALTGGPDQDLISTIDELAAQLTKAQKEIKALKDELKQYA